MRFSSSTLLIGAGLAHVAIANYAVQDDYSGNNFFSMFNFDTVSFLSRSLPITCPTHSLV